MSEDIPESLWNFLQTIFKHHSKIHKLNKPYEQSSRFCPIKTENTYFWNPTWNSHSFKTTGPNDPKFKPQLAHKVYNNFDLDKFPRKPNYQRARIELLPCCPEQLLTPLINYLMT